MSEADGFVGTGKVMLESPSMIATGIGESLPQMLSGAGIVLSILKAVPAGGPGADRRDREGVTGSGSAAEQRQAWSRQRSEYGRQGVSAFGVGDVDLGMAWRWTSARHHLSRCFRSDAICGMKRVMFAGSHWASHVKHHLSLCRTNGVSVGFHPVVPSAGIEPASSA